MRHFSNTFITGISTSLDFRHMRGLRMKKEPADIQSGWRSKENTNNSNRWREGLHIEVAGDSVRYDKGRANSFSQFNAIVDLEKRHRVQLGYAHNHRKAAANFTSCWRWVRRYTEGSTWDWRKRNTERSDLFQYENDRGVTEKSHFEITS